MDIEHERIYNQWMSIGGIMSIGNGEIQTSPDLIPKLFGEVILLKRNNTEVKVFLDKHF